MPRIPQAGWVDRRDRRRTDPVLFRANRAQRFCPRCRCVGRGLCLETVARNLSGISDAPTEHSPRPPSCLVPRAAVPSQK